MIRIENVLYAYAFVGLITFGYSYNADYTYGGYSPNEARALLCAVAWPAYVVTKAFSWLKPAPPAGGAKDGN